MSELIMSEPSLPQSANESAQLGQQSLVLSRFPRNQKNASLQAWDAADEYLVNYSEEHQLVTPNTKLLLVNDGFGALACAFNHAKLYHLNDSYIAEQAAQFNLEQNQLNVNTVQFLKSLDALPTDLDLVIIKVPKNTGYLSYILSQLSQVLKPNTKIIAAARAKDIHTSTLQLFERFSGPTKSSLAVKKARLIFSQQHNKPQSSKFPVKWPLEKTAHTLTNHANVFSRDSLDIGARFFINYLPSGNKKQRIIDLGCGNGVIGLSTLSRCPNAQLTFIDESFMAVESARANITHNLPQQIEQCTFLQSDCLSGVDSNSADLILCNPPFHQQQAVTDHIAWQMFVDSYRCLREGGELRIVGNRHLNYHDKLTRLFGRYKLLGSNKKFVVLSTKKRAL
jgi:16S rRNA (guanine1207-N2)-methyltransferase/23S rRNA (guanine1835-N2)-methyltransferase